MSKIKKNREHKNDKNKYIMTSKYNKEDISKVEDKKEENEGDDDNSKLIEKRDDAPIYIDKNKDKNLSSYTETIQDNNSCVAKIEEDDRTMDRCDNKDRNENEVNKPAIDNRLFEEIENTYMKLTSSTDTIMRKLDEQGRKVVDNVTDAFSENADYLMNKTKKTVEETLRNENRILKFDVSKCQDEVKNSTRVISNNIDNMQQNLKQSISGITNNMQPIITPVVKGIKNLQDDMSEQSEMIQDKLNGITGIVETTVGKLASLDKVDELAEVLKAKGTYLKREFPASNHEEETIVALSNYGMKVMEELTIAARLYARNAKAIDEIRDERTKHEEQLTKTKTEFYDKGYEAAKNKVTNDLLVRLMGCFDMAKLMTYNFGDNYSDNCLKTLISFLMNNGMETSEELCTGANVEITEDNMSRMEGMASFTDGCGRYVVNTPCIYLNGQIYKKAVLIKKDEDVKPSGDDYTQQSSDNHTQAGADNPTKQGAENQAQQSTDEHTKPDDDNHAQESADNPVQKSSDNRTQQSADDHTQPDTGNPAQQNTDHETQPDTGNPAQQNTDHETQPSADHEAQQSDENYNSNEK